MPDHQITEADLPVVNAMADVIRAYLAFEAPHVLAQMFNQDVEEIAMRVLPIAQAAVREQVCAELVAFADAQPKLGLDGWNAVRHIAPHVIRGESERLGALPADPRAGLWKFEGQVRERVAQYVEKMADRSQAWSAGDRAAEIVAVGDAGVLRGVAGWCRDDTIWNGDDQ